jgi:hypothetical protein
MFWRRIPRGHHATYDGVSGQELADLGFAEGAVA